MEEVRFTSVLPHAAAIYGGIFAGYAHAKTGTNMHVEPYVWLTAPTLAVGFFSAAVAQYNKIMFEQAIDTKEQQIANPAPHVISGFIFPHEHAKKSFKTIAQLQLEKSDLEKKVAQISLVRRPLTATGISTVEASVGYTLGRVIGTYF